MSQNTSSAVMQQRASPRDEGLDDFPTPPWATRALIEHVLWPDWPEFDPPASFQKQSVWEPACNRGFMARPLTEYFGRTHFSDIRDYGWEGQHRTVDFLFPGSEDLMAQSPPDWIITNPPFRLALQFVHRAWACNPNWGVAVLVRTAFLEGVNRYQELFSKSPPSIVAQFSERVPMVEGRFDPEASTATSYCWLVWQMGVKGTQLKWIPPCRKYLERAEDPRP
jgi:hypothetical protein